MNSNEIVFNAKSYNNMKTGRNSLNQMPVRKFLNSLNLKIPELKIYSFKSCGNTPDIPPNEQTPKKSKLSMLKTDQLKSAKIQSESPVKIETKTTSNGNSLATTESSYNKPQSGGASETKQQKPSNKCLVMKNYKGIQDKMKPGGTLRRTGGSASRTDFKPKTQIEKSKNLDEERKYVDIDTLKGIMLEGREIIEGFSESTIRIEPEFDRDESQQDILMFLDEGFKK